MKSKININRQHIGSNGTDKCRDPEANVLIDAGSPINAGGVY